MKSGVLKRVLAMTAASVLSVTTLAGCGSQAADTEGKSSKSSSSANGGTILWMSNLSSGPQYEAMVAYGTKICEEMGYNLKIVYGDGFNDPDGNLTAVKNGMTSDVVGILVSQDGGIQAIMDEYPDLPVAAFNTDMNSVFSEDANIASNAAVKDYPNFLGTIADGHINGADTAKQNFDYVVSQGYDKIGVVTFPGYAYPNLQEASDEIVKLCKEAGIEIVGGVVTLEFQPLDESYFQEADRDDLDALVALCAGTTFVYPTMVQAKGDKLCAADTKLITSGFDNDPSLVEDIGEDGTIGYLSISPCENIAYGLTLIDKAVKGEMYDDFVCERIDSAEYVIDSKEDIDNVTSKSILANNDYNDASVKYEDLQACNSFEDLKALFHSEQVMVDALK
ncbi:hypothetical protein SAMN02910384_00468 [Pseudobutyrivibrio sp. ACV-2]|uniref:hypothetical protein n=1 Tax=Pseudobutyrivibrio sp. ACV-2 TaxID=1520801 RepID=UPI00089B6A98|nr:hypothetical protein [Pseudobutyrivibrio sp. ACV-2]SDZ89242.1 hypothetical protein SAMN02910384_00468 [Pseudobutyrivibrio sp. ACV-2]